MSTTHRDEKFKTLILLGIVLAILGLGISLYSLYHHVELKYHGDTSFGCNINETLSCDDIANSVYSEDPWGNPLGIYGAGYFLGLLVLLTVARLKPELRRDTLQTYAFMVAIGVLVSLSLAGISHFIIGKICPSCVGVYAVTIVQALVLFFCRESLPRPFHFKHLSNGVWYGVMALGVALALFQLLKPSPTRNMTLDVPKKAQDLVELREQINKMQGGAVGALASLDKQAAASVKIDFSAYSGLGEDFRKGSDDAKVKIVEYADFQCPACATASRAMRQLASEFGDKILVVFKAYPLDKNCNPGMQSNMHPFACEAAVMARCAGNYGKFWEMHDQLFENQSSIDSTRILAWSKALGLTDAQIQECKNSKDIVAKIQDDIKQANAAGLTGTPTVYFNGRKYNGPVDADQMRAVIQALLEP